MKVLKVLSIVFVLALSCSLFAACGSGGSDEQGLVGSWASEDFNGAYVYTFNEDGSGSYDAAGVDMPFTYTDTDGALSIMYDGDTIPFETEYTIDGKKLTLKDSFGEDVVYVRK